MNPSSNPYEPMDHMFEQMRRSLFGPEMRGNRTFGGGNMNLRTEETEDGYVVMADLPGFEKSDITVRLDDDQLTIAAVSETSDESESTVRSHSRRVHETLQVPTTVIEDEVAASYRNGVLEIRLPTAEELTADDGHVIDIK